MVMQRLGKQVFAFFAGLVIVTVIVLYWIVDTHARLPINVDKVLTKEEKSEIVSRNSSLTDYVYLSPSADFPRGNDVKKITIHHMAGDMSLEELGDVFSNGDRAVSATYGIDVDGRVGLYVEESNRPWSSRNVENDDQSITIEVANDTVGDDWHVSAKSYESLIQLCIDICKRNGIEKLVWTGDASGNLTTHDMFADTECPGPYLKAQMKNIANSVNKRLEDG